MSAQTVYTQASTLITSSTSPANSGPLTVGNFAELAVDINITSNQGSSPTIQYFVDRFGVDGIWYPIWQSPVVAASTDQISASIGAGLDFAESFGGTIRFRWSIGGSSTPGFTYSVSLQAK